ncbi:DUF6515 family protein [Pseudomonas fulva]|uniref:DUF6515 family protein n=1 Tax=Pseudomonas fulva TaxID=47880 RepID=UPI00346234C3
MKSHIWQWAGVGLLGMGISVAALAAGPNDGPGALPPAATGPGVEAGPAPGRALNSRDEVGQTQPPRPGFYQDIPRRPDDGPRWHGPGPGYAPHEGWQGRPGGRGEGWGPGPHYRPGQTVERFADRFWKVPYQGQDYFYSGGYWYRPWERGYQVVVPPPGARVSYLPPYAHKFRLDGAMIYLVADTYYRYLENSREYVVVNPPAPAPTAASGYDVVAYPRYGQGQEQQDQDRYQCHRWAVSQSGFDPAMATYAPAPAVVSTYQRTLGACLSGRGYSVN